MRNPHTHLLALALLWGKPEAGAVMMPVNLRRPSATPAVENRASLTAWREPPPLKQEGGQPFRPGISSPPGCTPTAPPGEAQGDAVAGNRFGLVLKSLPVHLPTARQRLATVRARMQLVKLGIEAPGLPLQGGWWCWGCNWFNQAKDSGKCL